MTDTPLVLLQRSLSRHGLDGYLVPRSDAHLGEDVAPDAERLLFLSGFTGSAGLAVVLADAAALFTDGRYMLQAPEETGTAWECVHSGRVPVRRWLEARHGSGLRLGYDPMLLPAETLKELAGSWGGLVPLPENLVDAVWAGRPAAPNGPARIQDAAIAGRTVGEKLALVAAALRDAGEDAAVLSDPASVCWVFNLRGDDLPHTPAVLAHALVRADGTATLFLDRGRIDAAVAAHLGEAVAVLPPAAMAEVLSGCAGARVRVDPARSPVWFEQRLRAAGADIVAAADPCLMPKARKTAAELREFREAHRQDGAALSRFLFWVVRDGVGRSEHAVSERLLRFRMETGACSGASFASIAAAGSNAALMHYRPTASHASVLRAGELFLIDSGGQYRGATTDVTRTVWLGDETPPAALLRQFTRVLQGLIALSEAVFPDGTSGHRLDVLTRLALWRDGLDFDHGAGHGLGSHFSVHEWPYAFAFRPPGGPVHESMVLTNEPGYYRPGSHGIRLENAIAVEKRGETEDGASSCGFETLTLAPIDRRLIDAALLSAAERDWVDAYHARVLAEIGPMLADGDAAALRAACAPLVLP